MLVYTILGQVYGSGPYGASTYGNGSVVSPTPAPGASLTNTGFDLLLVGSVAAALIVAAILVRVWRRPAGK